MFYQVSSDILFPGCWQLAAWKSGHPGLAEVGEDPAVGRHLQLVPEASVSRHFVPEKIEDEAAFPNFSRTIFFLQMNNRKNSFFEVAAKNLKLVKN